MTSDRPTSPSWPRGWPGSRWPAAARTAHAAIVARSLGLPMVTGLPQAVLEIPDGEQVVLDGGGGDLIVRPSEPTAAAQAGDGHARRAAAQHSARTICANSPR